MSEMRRITRMDYPHAVGWWVRIYAGGELLAQKMFSDAERGGRKKALIAAKDWRNAQEIAFAKQIASTKSSLGRAIHLKNSRNLSGVVGVAPDLSKDRTRVAAWRASWTDEGGARRFERFSVTEHGYAGAFKKAVEKRCRTIGKPVPRISAPTEQDILVVLGA